MNKTEFEEDEIEIAIDILFRENPYVFDAGKEGNVVWFKEYPGYERKYL